METLESVVTECLPWLQKKAAALIGQVESDDLVGDTLLAAVQGWPKFRGDAKAKTWLCSVMRRQYFMRLRAAGYRRTVKLGVYATLDKTVELNEARDAVGRLDRKQRETVARYYYCGQRYAEIATAMNVPVGTVRSRLSQAKANLWKSLEVAS